MFTVGTFKRPELDELFDEDLEIDIVKNWSDLEKEFIAEGLISGGLFSCLVLNKEYQNNTYQWCRKYSHSHTKYQ